MKNVFDTDERGKAYFEQMIRGIRPGVELKWTKEERSELFTIYMLWRGRSATLVVSRESLDQAADDDASHPRLASEAERQLRISESGGYGIVREV